MKRLFILSTLALLGATVPALANKPSVDDDLKLQSVQVPVNQRFAPQDVAEVPSFQRHLVPLIGRLGCNGRACHGSFQGQGGFRLSLFGYDFKLDHDGLAERVDTESPKDSYALEKATLAVEHKGGKRMELDSWQYRLFYNWIKSGAKNVDKEQDAAFVRLEITPDELLFKKAGEVVQLQAVAVWADGSREDVTPLCRFQTNDDQIAKIDENGRVTSDKPGDTHVVVFYDNAVRPIAVLQPVSALAGGRFPQVSTPTKVDELVVDKLRKLGVVPSDVSTDAEFLRRVSLDVTGTLPSPTEVEEFLADQSSDKRARKIDQLLETPAYAAWWTTKLCDFTGNNDYQLQQFLPQYNRGSYTASKSWYDWIYKRVQSNQPYDKLVEGIVLSTSRKPDQSYTDYCEQMSAMYRDGAKETFSDLDDMVLYWARREFRDPEPRAISFAYAFLGIRIQCAQCHKHPFDQWSKEDFAEFTNFFRQVAASNNRPADRKDAAEYEAILKKLNLDTKKGGNEQRREFGRLLNEGKTVPFAEVAIGPVRASRGDDIAVTEMKSAKLLGGEAFELKRNEDIRKPLMDWLRGDQNPFFARAFVNRVWASYFNRGIVEPPDDNSLANPPSNKPLLDYLAQGFIDSGFDMKWVHRTIATSRTYQLSWKPNDTNKFDEVNFSHALPRRLPAEVVYDAIVEATSTDEKALAMRDELDGRAIAIPGAGNRNGGGNNGGGNTAYALQVFGRSTRESNCDCDRSMEPSLLQTVFLQNDQTMLGLIEKGGWLNEVAKEYKLTQPQRNDDSGKRRAAKFEQTVQQQKAAIKKARKAGNDELVQRLQKKLNEETKKFDESNGEASPSAPERAAVDAESLVKEAYLRTLSRLPEEHELKRSVEHIQQSADTLSGIRNLLWALLNTKEFIVNH